MYQNKLNLAQASRSLKGLDTKPTTVKWAIDEISCCM